MTLPPLLRKLVGYVGTGGAAAVVDLGGFVLLVAAGLPAIPSAAASFVVSAGVNYLLSARFVFRARAGWGRFPLFLAMATLGFLVNVSLTAAGLLVLDLPPALAKLGAIAIAFGFNFLVNAFYVFADD